MIRLQNRPSQSLARRLRKKLPPFGGVKLLSLERLERMNRHALNLAFLAPDIQAAINEIKEFRKGRTLSGVATIRELIEEGRRF